MLLIFFIIGHIHCDFDLNTQHSCFYSSQRDNNNYESWRDDVFMNTSINRKIFQTLFSVCNHIHLLHLITHTKCVL
ncbi:hypothetical protein [Psilogramma increta granulovirus]|uniref:Uncharacterized protein n=1 Tax=Psilogramma increta granulovirus TaxID=2953508 RepID=A0A977XVL2_9BBAC|nr:hypothetical protein [Psilogramma increta granulovirus]